MAIDHRQFVAAKRMHTRMSLRETSFMPRFIKRELTDKKKDSRLRFIYCERYDIHTFGRFDAMAYQKAARMRRRQELGHRMVRKVYGPHKDNFLGR